MKKRIRRKVRLLKKVPPGRFWLVVKLGIFGFFVPMLMRLPLARSKRLLVPSDTSQTNETILEATEQRCTVDEALLQDYLICTDIALRLGRPLTQNRCLTRCVTLYYFLSRRGVDLTIVFGAGSLEGKFAAHCWLEIAGEPVFENENPYSVYSPTYAIPASEAETKVVACE